MDLLKRANAHATFFVIFEQFHKASLEVQRVFMQRSTRAGTKWASTSRARATPWRWRR